MPGGRAGCYTVARGGVMAAWRRSSSGPAAGARPSSPGSFRPGVCYCMLGLGGPAPAARAAARLREAARRAHRPIAQPIGGRSPGKCGRNVIRAPGCRPGARRRARKRERGGRGEGRARGEREREGDPHSRHLSPAPLFLAVPPPPARPSRPAWLSEYSDDLYYRELGAGPVDSPPPVRPSRPAAPLHPTARRQPNADFRPAAVESGASPAPGCPAAVGLFAGTPARPRRALCQTSPSELSAPPGRAPCR